MLSSILFSRSHSTASAPLLPSDLGWSASLDVSPLRPGELDPRRDLATSVSKSVSKCELCQGQEYRLCADGDGSGPLHEGTANTGRFGFRTGGKIGTAGYSKPFICTGILKAWGAFAHRK